MSASLVEEVPELLEAAIKVEAELQRLASELGAEAEVQVEIYPLASEVDFIDGKGIHVVTKGEAVIVITEAWRLAVKLLVHEACHNIILQHLFHGNWERKEEHYGGWEARVGYENHPEERVCDEIAEEYIRALEGNPAYGRFLEAAERVDALLEKLGEMSCEFEDLVRFALNELIPAYEELAAALRELHLPPIDAKSVERRLRELGYL